MLAELAYVALGSLSAFVAWLVVGTLKAVKTQGKALANVQSPAPAAVPAQARVRQRKRAAPRARRKTPNGVQPAAMAENGRAVDSFLDKRQTK